MSRAVKVNLPRQVTRQVLAEGFFSPRLAFISLDLAGFIGILPHLRYTSCQVCGANFGIGLDVAEIRIPNPRNPKEARNPNLVMRFGSRPACRLKTFYKNYM
jgi:hypothetical protein